MDAKALEAKFARMLAEAQAQCDSVTEAHKRWNRVEEAIDPVCEDAIFLLDRIGRIDQADEIHSHMALDERFDLLTEAFAREKEAIRAESEEKGFAAEYAESSYLLEKFAPWVAQEKKRAGK